jgi:hypothetical protein
VYANDHLSPANAVIFRKLRKLKRMKKIDDVRSNDCRIQLRLENSERWKDVLEIVDLQQLLSLAD